MSELDTYLAQNRIERSECSNKTRPRVLLDSSCCLLYTILIFAGLYTNVAAFAAFGIVVFVFFLLPSESIIRQLLYLLAFASVFKLGPSSTSLFTVIELYTTVLLFLRRRRVQIRDFLLVFFFACYILLFAILNSNVQPLLIVKLIAALALMFQMKNSNFRDELGTYVVFFSVGLLFASALAYFGFASNVIEQYIVMDSAYEIGLDTIRFSGLCADPNYYVVNVFIAIISLLVLNNAGTSRRRLLSYLMIFALLFFGMQTLSKSFVLMLAIIFVFFILMCLQQRRYKTLISFFIVSMVLLAFYYSGYIETLNLIIDRFNGAETMNDLTTNRWNTWTNYFKYLWEHPLSLFFGGGLGRDNFGMIGAHNAYIECLASLGIVGILLFFWVLKTFMRGPHLEKRRLQNFGVLIVILVMYMFLGMLTWIDLPFHLFLCYCFINFDFSIKEDKDV